MITAICTIRCIVVIFLGLLTFTASASAECAWVLWSQDDFVQARKVETKQWTADRALPSSNECELTMKIQIADTQARIQGARVFGNGYSFDVQGVTLIRRFVCLPDTVDPRGPKGK